MAEFKHVDLAPLNVPPLSELAAAMQLALDANFEKADVEVVKCPDLRSKWDLPAPGLCGKSTLVEVGGVPNLCTDCGHSINFSLPDVARAIGLPGAFMLGASAASVRRVKTNAELMPCTHLQTGIRATRYAFIDKETREYKLKKYPWDEVGFLGNIYASEGLPGPAIKVTASVRKGPENFVTCLRKGVAALVQSPTDHMGFGGVFRVVRGQIHAHVMPDFPDTPLSDDHQIQQWLRFFDMGPGMTCLSTFVTGDPTGGRLNLRLEHTHFFNPETGDGGHYHFSSTPKEVQYEAYFCPAKRIARIDDPKRCA